jgi:drug/metabolite transporter (DMT)-like permease
MAGALASAWWWNDVAAVLGGVIGAAIWFVLRALLWTGRQGRLDAALWTIVWAIAWVMLAVVVHHLLHLWRWQGQGDESLHEQVLLTFVAGSTAAVVGSVILASLQEWAERVRGSRGKAAQRRARTRRGTMKDDHPTTTLLPTGVGAAIFAAVLFGASTPFAKLLLGEMRPGLLAGLLYLGSGLGLSVIYLVRRKGTTTEAPLVRSDVPWLAGAVFFGGVLGPLLLMLGLSGTPASTASLLLNLEGVFTALLAWFAFHENFDRRIALGMGLIVLGGALLSWQGTAGVSLPLGSLAVAGACLCWGIDNNLTQKVSAGDPLQVTAIKGAVAGSVNLAIALMLGASLPRVSVIGGALLVGLLGYGVSLVLFVLSLRHIGTARTGAYFSLAPFVGAAVSLLLLREPIGLAFGAAAALMGLGVWLHLTERHEHAHHHETLTHSHRHVHDEHHQHEHPPGVDPSEPHTHEHTHEPLTHSHPHYPDIHHRHRHA